jgi:protein subunit release factor B
MFDPDAHMPLTNRGMVYLGACVRLRIQIDLAEIKIDSGRSSGSPGQLHI